MATWKLFVFGHEVLRTESDPEADKTLGAALAELLEPEEEAVEVYPELTDEERAPEDEDRKIIFRGGD